MKVDRIPVTWFLERLYCDCGGEMKHTGMVLTSYPPQYPHKCSKCEFGVTLRESYPRVMWEEVPSAPDPLPSDATPRTPDGA